MKRTGKFYRNNEKEVMRNLGLNPTKNSGSGWIEKEDGENETLIAQLKSTDAESIKINLLDLKKLFYHAGVSNKTGVFIIQFLQGNEELLLIRPEDLQKVAEGLQIKPYSNIPILNKVPCTPSQRPCRASDKNIPQIKSGSKSARDKFYKQREELYNGKGKH